MVKLTLRSAFGAAALAAILPLAISCSAAASVTQRFQLQVLSSQADAVTGDNVLVQVLVPPRAFWTITLNDKDVTAQFGASQRSAGFVALLTQLRSGENDLRVLSQHRVEASAALRNHSSSGPVFSGPHQAPFVCQTLANGLGAPLDANCNAPKLVRYYYRSTQPAGNELPRMVNIESEDPLGPAFKPYNPNSSPPADLARTVTSEGRTVNYIVRRESGTLNRGVYEILFLHQPGEQLPSPWARGTAGWNGRLIYTFLGGCGGGHHQGLLFGFQQLPLLGAGYALATSTLNVFRNTCNEQLSAETLSMVKEHFIESFGRPMHTIGEGGSGGAMQVYLIAQNHPGLLDGIVANASFPDVVTYVPPAMDCALLHRAFESSKENWREEQKTAVSGFATWRTCGSELWLPLDVKNCDKSIPAGWVYDPSTNPGGVRCDIYSNLVNVFGSDPNTGLVRRPLDNVGVEYGLIAFNAGQITADQFVDLNERVGGYDAQGNLVAERMEADAEALRLAYAEGSVLVGGGDLSRIPIVDLNTYLDDQGNTHDRVRALQIRARLLAANGAADNQVILVRPADDAESLLSPASPTVHAAVRRLKDIFLSMSQWLDAIAADRTSDPVLQKIVRNQPTELSDSCWLRDGSRVIERQKLGLSGKCNDIYRPHADPRMAAGAPFSGDILKCSLQPINRAAYAQPLTDGQFQRLRRVFPKGVCDYTRPGVHQQSTQAISLRR